MQSFRVVNKIVEFIIKFIFLGKFHQNMQEIDYGFSPERKQKLSRSGLRQQIKQRLDELLENDFAALRRGEVDDLLLKNHNVLVLEYVKSIYDEYRIQDPLQSHHSRISFTPSVKKNRVRQKIHLMSTQTAKQSTPQRQKPTPSSGKNEESFNFVGDESTVKKDYFQNSTTIKASLSYFEPQHRESQDNTIILPPPSDSEREGYSEILRSRERKQLEMIVEDEARPSSEDPESSRNRGFTIPLESINTHHKEQKAVLPPEVEEIVQSSRKLRGYVAESFRYCIGCEIPLLHANIHFHESTCLQFQRVYQMQTEEIVTYLKEKVGAFERQIRQQALGLAPEDISCLQESSQRMMEESRSISDNGILTAGFELEYRRVVQVGRRWCLLTELINKVNWFLKIRQRIKSQFRL